VHDCSSPDQPALRAHRRISSCILDIGACGDAALHLAPELISSRPQSCSICTAAGHRGLRTWAAFSTPGSEAVQFSQKRLPSLREYVAVHRSIAGRAHVSARAQASLDDCVHPPFARSMGPQGDRSEAVRIGFDEIAKTGAPAGNPRRAMSAHAKNS